MHQLQDRGRQKGSKKKEKNKRPNYILSTRSQPKYKDAYRWKVNGWRKYTRLTLNKRRQSSQIIISGKEVFKVSKVSSDKAGRDVTRMGSILQEDVAVFNVHVPDSRASNYMRQKPIRTQGETGTSLPQLETSTPPLSEMDGTIQQAENQQGHSGSQQHRPSTEYNWRL